MDDYIQPLRKVQLEILDEIDRVCRENGLTYFLAFGTLLGAIRHKGYIPWDDDIDVFMPQEDYERFCKGAAGMLDSRFALHSPATDPKYWLKFAKVERKGTLLIESVYDQADVNMGIYVDVFPLDNVRGNTPWVRFKKACVQKIEILLRLKRGIYKMGWFKTMLANMLPFRWLQGVQRWLMKGRSNCRYFMYYGVSPIPRLMLPKEECLPVGNVEFEGKIYNSPKDCHKALVRMFGPDYMQLPPVEQRVTHNPVRIEFGDAAGKES